MRTHLIRENQREVCLYVFRDTRDIQCGKVRGVIKGVRKVRCAKVSCILIDRLKVCFCCCILYVPAKFCVCVQKSNIKPGRAAIVKHTKSTCNARRTPSFGSSILGGKLTQSHTYNATFFQFTIYFTTTILRCWLFARKYFPNECNNVYIKRALFSAFQNKNNSICNYIHVV